MRKLIALFLALGLVFGMGGIVGCESDPTDKLEDAGEKAGEAAEDAGEAVEKAAEDTKDAAEDAADDLDN